MSEDQEHDHKPKDPAVKLAKMAGQIAAFFSHYPEDKAIASIAEHINKFWSKKMRQDFLKAYQSDQAALGDLLGKALQYIKH
jgi:formate dehydrogenase subunit delta